MKKINFKPETAVTLGLAALGVAQMLLSNKKDKNDRAALKSELKDEIVKDLLQDKN